MIRNEIRAQVLLELMHFFAAQSLHIEALELLIEVMVWAYYLLPGSRRHMLNWVKSEGGYPQVLMS